MLDQITRPVFYLTNDVSRAIGLEKLLPNYHIICLDDHPLVDMLQQKGVSVFCLERALKQKNIFLRSSSLIIKHPLVLQFIKEKSGNLKPAILFFKPQKKLEIIAEQNNFQLIGNSRELNQKFEDKINFYQLAKENNLPILTSQVLALNDLDLKTAEKQFGLPLVVQFGFGWAGNSTFFILDQTDLQKLQQTYGQIKVKISRFIKGITVLNNAVVLPNSILQSQPAIQIKANSSLTSMPGGTGGRQWPVVLTKDQEYEIEKITQQTGEIMQKSGYLGFFGLDFLVEEQTKKIYLSENNSRLTASATFYTQLQLEQNQIPLLAYHLLSFLAPEQIEDVNSLVIEGITGSEIIGRNTNDFAVLIKKSLTPGLYNQELTLKKASLWLEEKVSDFWLTAADVDRVVNPEIEMVKINSFEKVVDENGVLLERYNNVVQKIRDTMVVKRK